MEKEMNLQLDAFKKAVADKNLEETNQLEESIVNLGASLDLENEDK